MLARKMLLASVTSFEVSPYDFIKTIACNKAVFNLPDLKCKENCNLAMKRLNKVLTDYFIEIQNNYCVLLTVTILTESKVY